MWDCFTWKIKNEHFSILKHMPQIHTFILIVPIPEGSIPNITPTTSRVAFHDLHKVKGGQRHLRVTTFQVSNEKTSRCLVYIRDRTTQLQRDQNKPLQGILLASMLLLLRLLLLRLVLLLLLLLLLLWLLLLRLVLLWPTLCLPPWAAQKDNNSSWKYT